MEAPIPRSVVAVAALAALLALLALCGSPTAISILGLGGTCSSWIPSLTSPISCGYWYGVCNPIAVPECLFDNTSESETIYTYNAGSGYIAKSLLNLQGTNPIPVISDVISTNNR